MGHEYKSLRELERDFPFFNSGASINTLKLFIIGEEESARLRGCEVTKRMLEGMSAESVQSGSIAGFEVEILDTSKQEERELMEDIRFWNKFGAYHKLSQLPTEPAHVYIPIFHNADAHTNLAQHLFDTRRPGFISLTEKGYESVVNYSKRSCYDVVRV